MGIKERQERDREAVRRSILDAARELFVSEGYRNVSIRKIAEKIEYSPAAISACSTPPTAERRSTRVLPGSSRWLASARSSGGCTSSAGSTRSTSS
jgi:hypothetical protein